MATQIPKRWLAGALLLLVLGATYYERQTGWRVTALKPRRRGR